MQLSVTFRHMDSTDALRDYAKEKVERIRKYFPDPIKAHVVLVCDRGYNHTADVMITLHNGLVIKGVETTEDMYSSIDLVMAKIERQVRRYKEKIRSHKGNEGLHGQREIIHSVMASAAPKRASGASANGHGKQRGGGDHQEVEVLRQAADAQRGGHADEPPEQRFSRFHERLFTRGQCGVSSRRRDVRAHRDWAKRRRRRRDARTTPKA